MYADRGYQGAGPGILVPNRRRYPGAPTLFNSLHAKIRAVGERAIATLKQWRIPRRIRACPTQASALIAAILTLHLNVTT